MTALESRISQILAKPLERAERADKAVGYVGLDIPDDLLQASGVTACHLPWQAGTPTPFADRWLEPSFPGWARSIVEDWSKGRFDFFDSVVFTRGDDASQRLYYYLCELQRRGRVGGPRPLIFDIAKIRRPSSVDWTVRAVERLVEELQLDETGLGIGIQNANRRREWLMKFSQSRGRDGSLCERIARASLFDSLDDIDIADVPQGKPQNHRLVLAGSSPPDDRLHKAAEGSGWFVVAEACDRSLGRLGPVLQEPHDNVAAAIGAHCHALQSGPRSFADRAAALRWLAASAKADAVAIWLIEEDEALAWDLVAQKRAIESLEIPLLAMTRRRWDCSDGAGRELGDFLRGLGS